MLIAPMSMLLEMLSRWPRYLSHGPAMEMWSVVHLPLALMRMAASLISSPSHGLKGVRICRRFDLGSTLTDMPLPSDVGRGAWYVSMPGSKPLDGSSSPPGISSVSSFPSAPTSVSFSGLNVKSPAIAMAVTSSGDATKQCVAGLPSLRAAKLRLNDVMMELASPLATSVRFHWPMHGPHELDSTVPPILANVSIMPSRSIVARICSEPGEMVNGTLALMPAASACFAMDAARAMSSYEELVHEPMSAALSSVGHPCFFISDANLDSGCARSGVKGPLTCGSSSLRFTSISWS
mmetsp:Transcript_33922/g.100966  ORF Transcript_33922/g.100966 Transcript_33922/m.100966 type:complete len:293 (+) Transcript_33922:705-1583(+)